jgi:hypothetical protein
MAEPNHVNALVAFLRADADVAARVSARVFGPDGVPKSQNTSMPQPAIVVSAAGGLGAIGAAYQDYSDKRVDIACYGRTQAESYSLFLAVRQALKDMQRIIVSDQAGQRAVLHWARIAADGVTARDPVTEWPMTLSSWQVLTSEVGVPA